MTTTTNARQARLPIWRDANRLLVEIEQAVRRFPRCHKYALYAICICPPRGRRWVAVMS